jgi:hypothetical protein
MEIEMYQLEIDYEMVGPKWSSFDEAEKWMKSALEAGALRVAIWHQQGESRCVVKSSGVKLQKLIFPNMS